MADDKKPEGTGFPTTPGIPVMSMLGWTPPPETKAAADALLGLPDGKYKPPVKDDQNGAATR